MSLPLWEVCAALTLSTEKLLEVALAGNGLDCSKNKAFNLGGKKLSVFHAVILTMTSQGGP